MAFRIIADSSCDIFDLDRKIDGLYFNTVPFVITVDGKDFVDDEHLDVNELVEAMAVSSKREMCSRSQFHPISREVTTALVPRRTWCWKTIRTEISRSLTPAERDPVFP